MLREVDLTLEKAIALARADEETKKQTKQMNAATSAESVDNLHNKSKASISNRKSQQKSNKGRTKPAISKEKNPNQEMYSLRL